MKIRIVAAVMAAFFMLPFFSVTAFAGGGDCYDYTEPEPATEIPATEGPAAETELNPFTPAGTGTVIDTATDGDGKEFYTIMTPTENVFYLVIDRQRETENVYFLNAVTEADLLALAEISETPEPEPAPVEQAPAPTPEPEPDPVPEPEKGGGMGMILFVVVVVLIGGGAGYYFKIYRPKQQQADPEDDFDYEGGESELYDGDEYGAEPDDDPPWYDEDENGGDGDA